MDLSWVDVEDLLRHLDLSHVSRSGSEVDFSCPGSDHAGGDRHPSARMNVDSTAWICHSCGLRGNAVGFVSMVRHVSDAEALLLLTERYGGPERSSITSLPDEITRLLAVPEPIRRRVPPREEWLDYWTDRFWSDDGYQARAYMLGRGFLPSTLVEWQIGYDPRSRRVVIPVRDHEGRLVGVKGRDWTGAMEPKYLIIGGFGYDYETYHKSHHVFGLDRAEGDAIVVVEGELNVIAMRQHGHRNVVGIAGKDFSERQARLIVARARSALVWLDDDAAGREGTEKVVDALRDFMLVSVVEHSPGDAAELDAETITSVLASVRPWLVARVEGLTTAG